jgi:hypothetical protein
MVERVRRTIDSYTPEQRADLGRLAAVGLLGLIVGLFIGWIVWPVERSNATFDDLRPDLRAHYLAALADSYVAAGGQNPEITLARVGQMKDPAAALADAIRFYQANPSAASAVAEINLRTLAAALGEDEAVMRSLQEDEAVQSGQRIEIDEPAVGWLPWLVVIFTAILLIFGGLWIGYQLLSRRFEEEQRATNQAALPAVADNRGVDAFRQTSAAEQMAAWHAMHAMIGDDDPPDPTATRPVNVNVTVQPPKSAPSAESAQVVYETEVGADTDLIHFTRRSAENVIDEIVDFADDEEIENDELEDDEVEDDEIDDNELDDDEAKSPADDLPQVTVYRTPPNEIPSNIPDPGITPAGGTVWDSPSERPSNIPDPATRRASTETPQSGGEATLSASIPVPPLPGPATTSSARRKPVSVAAHKPAQPPTSTESGRANLQNRLSNLWRKDTSERREDAIAKFTAHYQYGIPDYEESFVISPQDELMGACGMGIATELDPKAASTDKIHVLDVWFYDRSHMHTYRQLLVSRSANWDNLTGKANNSGTVTGEPLVAAPGVTFKLHGKDLMLDCRIESVEYLNEDDHLSPFRNVTLSMTARKK